MYQQVMRLLVLVWQLVHEFQVAHIVSDVEINV